MNHIRNTSALKREQARGGTTSYLREAFIASVLETYPHASVETLLHELCKLHGLRKPKDMPPSINIHVLEDSSVSGILRDFGINCGFADPKDADIMRRLQVALNISEPVPFEEKTAVPQEAEQL